MKEARTLCLVGVCSLTLGVGIAQADVIVALTVATRVSPVSSLGQERVGPRTPIATDAWRLWPAVVEQFPSCAFSMSGSVWHGKTGGIVGGLVPAAADQDAMVIPPAAAANRHGAVGSSEHGAIELPPPPSSSLLALTGLAGVAGVRGLRAARFSCSPSAAPWYFGLSPLGAEVIVSPDRNLPAWPTCLVEAATASLHCSAAKAPVSWVLPTRLESQHLPPASAPRGPPVALSPSFLLSH